MSRPGWEWQQDTEHARWWAEYDAAKEQSMGLTAKGTGGDFPPIPTGTHVARCYMVVDLGTQTSQFGIAHQILVGWELPTELMDDGRPFSASKFYRLSLNEKANLYKDLVNWRGRDFTDAELEGFNVFNVLGAPALVSIVTNDNGKNVVGSVTKLVKDMECPPAVNPTRKFSFEDGDDIPEDMPEWIADIIKKSPEWASRGGNGAGVPGGRAEPEPEFDDIPFSWAIGALATGLGGWAIAGQDLLQVLA